MKAKSLKQAAKEYKGDLKRKLKNKKFKEKYNMELRLIRLAREVEEARKKKHISQKKLADLTGMKQQEISRFEKGEQNATYFTVVKMLNALGKDIKIINRNEKIHARN